MMMPKEFLDRLLKGKERQERLKEALQSVERQFQFPPYPDYAVSLKGDKRIDFKVRVKGVSGFGSIKVHVKYYDLSNAQPFSPSRIWVHRLGRSEQHQYNLSSTVLKVRFGLTNRPQVRAWASKDHDLVCFYFIQTDR